MNGVNGWLVAIIVVLIGALMFVLGQQSGQDGGDLLAELTEEGAEGEAAEEGSSTDSAPASPPPTSKRAVRIGTRGAGQTAWEKGPHSSDGIWGSHWYDKVNASTGFGSAPGELPQLEGAYLAVADECREDYEFLLSQAITGD